MNEVKKELIRDVTAIFTRLPPKKQERAIGIMQGMMIAAEEAGCGAGKRKEVESECRERNRTTVTTSTC